MAHFVFDKQVMLDQYDKVLSTCDIVSYSSKTNPYLTPMLQKQGSWVSVHFPTELRHCTQLDKCGTLRRHGTVNLSKSSLRKT